MNKKQERKRGKYRQISINQKEILIRLVHVDRKSIHEAAQISGINENTARSIIRIYRRDGVLISHARGGTT